MRVRADTIAPAVACLLLWATLPGAAHAQTAPEQSLIRALGEHYGLPAAEVAVLTEWRIPIDEIPVTLEVADRVGISPDALVAARRDGRRWAALAARYGLDVTAFHVELSSPPAPVAELYAALDERPPSRWSEVPFEDRHLIFLVNTDFLRRYTGVSADEAAAALAMHGSAAEALRALGS